MKNKLTAFKIVGFALLMILIVHLVDQYLMRPKPKEAPPPSVVVQEPQLMKTTVYITQTGTTVAYNAVNLVARIKGYLEQIEFTDGTFVKKGQELFVIEPLPYFEKLKEAEATVDAQKAAYDYDHIEFLRQKKMFHQNATSLNSVQEWEAKALKSKADIAKAKANQINAQIEFSYTHVLAPFDGRMGRHLIDPGNLVGNGAATILATIEQLDPIYVYFNLNELDLLEIREAIKSHALDVPDLNQVPVYVGLQRDATFNHEGRLNFANTGLNASTGTMEFRALLSNKDFDLLPGLFVQVRIPVGNPTKQLTLPDTAVLYDQIGAYVLTIDSKNTVILKRVKTSSCDQGRCAISQGIQRHDRVVVDGIQRATPGQRVQPTRVATS